MDVDDSSQLPCSLISRSNGETRLPSNINEPDTVENSLRQSGVRIDIDGRESPSDLDTTQAKNLAVQPSVEAGGELKDQPCVCTTVDVDSSQNDFDRSLEIARTCIDVIQDCHSKPGVDTDGLVVEATESGLEFCRSTDRVDDLSYSQADVEISSIVDISSSKCSNTSLASYAEDLYELCVTSDVDDGLRVPSTSSLLVPRRSDVNDNEKELNASTIERDGGDRLLSGDSLEAAVVPELPTRSHDRRSRDRTRTTADQRHMRKHSHPRSSSVKRLPTTPVKAIPDKLKRQRSDAGITYEPITDEEKKPSIFKSYTRRQLTTLISLCLADFASFLGISIMAPFFPLEARNKGMDDVVMGFVFSVYALVMLIFSPIIGQYLPLIGPKFAFLSGVFLTGMCTILFGVLDEIDDLNTFVFFCFLVRSFEALGAAACSTVSCTIVAEVFPDNVGAVFGIVETFIGLGMTAGPAIGGALYATGGYKLPFLVLGIIMVLMIPLNWLILPGIQASNLQVKPKLLFQLLTIPKMLITSMIVVMLATSWAFLDPFLEPHLNEAFSMTPQSVGLVFLLLSATYSIASPVFGWMADRWECTSLMSVVGSFLTAFGLLLLGPSDLFPIEKSYLWLDLVALVIMGVMVALALIPTFQAMMDVALDNDYEENLVSYSLVSGIWAASYSLGDFIGPSLGGFLVGRYDFAFACTILAVLTIIPAIVLLLYEMITATVSRNDAYAKLNGEIQDSEKKPLLSQT